MSKLINRRNFVKGSATSTLAAAAMLHPHVAHAQAGQRIRVGQIGTAHSHAAGKLATVRELSQTYELVGVVEPDPVLRAAAAKNKAYDGVSWMTEDELLGTDGLQCVTVETDIPELVPTGQRCVDAGMHIHLDKPAGESLAALRRLHTAASESGRCVQMGYMFRYNPAFQLTHDAITKGWLGDVFEIHGVMSKKVDQESRDVLRKLPGGTMYELGCHLVDALVWMLGKPTKTIPFIRNTLDDDLADNMIVMCEYPRATATIRSSVVEPYGQRRRQFTVVGTEGVAEIRPLEPPSVVLSLDQNSGPYKRGVHQPEMPPRRGRYDGDLLDLAAVIRGEKEFQFSHEHDLAAHETILRASGMSVDT
tara:strand:+ start:149471 stop:150559 length:1089 start_codon:yes stop_codon:yes gene_type:complete